MNCPKCQGVLVELHRSGVLIDVCKTCSGVWLDCGELESLIMNASFNYESKEYQYKQEKYKNREEFRKKHPVLYALKEIFD